ncbi:hypothetical protein JX265_008627 [Neoarthrinium moseri]|uniref:S-adenosyl-L-methionine-dependent methyltransferase n=1 Tax=Neoarthrinium moseri TaxID=1658444 RepID=A0A9Q0AMF5_9PEZI|nr:uncharacterized protein JN550_012991 [Neoarthrinium moseri]KAI1849216.1 hypothetical protein JX266_005177 [Neoarthrinium moseri]KAI1857851.1 hypothetical protein JN550_012991 [Neoarthrinium moseri]KAI1864256.1 hypothetical protein JX265_008627 [Neoarthrinium moseri]
MEENGAHDRKPSEASAESGPARSTSSETSKASHHSGSSGSLLNRKPTGYTIPDPVSVEEHGRTWNAYREGKYLLPNDALEQERLDLAHEMWRLLMFGDLAWVPFADEPRDVLDIGTGTGMRRRGAFHGRQIVKLADFALRSWAIEWAEHHPASRVVGTDISLIQPPEESIPSNCTFERDDVEEEWVFDRLFDYIHLRSMLTCFNNHTSVLQKVYDNLRPGGWVEYHEYDPEVFGKDDANQEALMASALWQWCQRLFRSAKRFGRDMLIARRYKQFLLDAGFVDVTERIILAPNKPWSTDPRERRIGQYMQANSLEMLDAVSAKLLLGDGMSTDESEQLNSRVRESFASPDLHLYSRMYVVYGRKPREGEYVPSRSQAPEGTEIVPKAEVKTELQRASRVESIATTDSSTEKAFKADGIVAAGEHMPTESRRGMASEELPPTTDATAADTSVYADQPNSLIGASRSSRGYGD